KIPISVAKRIVSGRSENVAEQGSRSYLPIKVNAAGVMPIIFAQAIVTIPMMLISGSDSETPSWFQTAFSNIYGVWYNALLALLIIVFTYFYTAITINPSDMADDLKKNGGFIPGVKPGSETTEYIDSLISRITLPGSIFLALIAIIPAIVHSAGITSGFEQFFGGTSLLIMVAVVLDTLQQINSYLLNRHMDGMVDNSRSRKRFSRKSSLNA
ncbi:MAG TPA: SecY family transport protein, partial [Crocinitomicaceae bacterium]|nr:SecY family transport protein [Crocinitomicaceae bacterium]